MTYHFACVFLTFCGEMAGKQSRYRRHEYSTLIRRRVYAELNRYQLVGLWSSVRAATNALRKSASVFIFWRKVVTCLAFDYIETWLKQ